MLLIIASKAIFCDTTITRGPEVGEIYFLAATRTTSAAIYHSMDFGETATCMDSTLDANMVFNSISADLTPGVIYSSHYNNLFISYNYGEEGSWIFRNNDVAYMQSGRTEGFIYNRQITHSEDYGNTFIDHLCQGYFGNYRASEIDNNADIGYVIVRESIDLDSMSLLISYDNFENLELQHIFYFMTNKNQISRGVEDGELYYHTSYFSNSSEGSNLRYSSDYGQSWETKNTFNCPYLPIKGIVGGRQPGEIYMLVQYVQNLHSRVHIYIYHSLDFGETFTIYPVLEYGPEPYFANFTASADSGTAPLTVQFSDTSSGGGISNWLWDFNDDGEIDSCEQNPEYTFSDSGTYRVTLEILQGMGNPELIASKHIHVSGSSGVENEEIVAMIEPVLKNFPNPFNPSTIISYELPPNIEKPLIEIFNLKGQRISELKIDPSLSNYAVTSDEELRTGSVVWDASGFASGIYLYRLNVENSQIKKMILFK
ncbi:MAG: PKD domain-containing protein [Saprospiraceae bacterium]|nr:PKD domain-containing protein [Saprospiraceae bacterium]